MTLEETIKYARAVPNDLRDSWLDYNQLADWLQELVDLRQFVQNHTNYPLFENAKPIVFNVIDMKALLEGRKTLKCMPVIASDIQEELPYSAGDILYVQESWAPCNVVSPDKYVYEADYDTTIMPYSRWEWNSSLSMPRDAARIFLRVDSVKRKKLQNITEAEALLSGVQQAIVNKVGGGSEPVFLTGLSHSLHFYNSAIGAFKALWSRSLTDVDKRLYEWSQNPDIYTVEFERIHYGKEL